MDRIIKRLSPQLTSEVKKELEKSALSPGLVPTGTVNPEQTTQWNFPPGFNMQSTFKIKRKQEGNVSYMTLRNFSVHYTIARACIDYVKTKVLKLNWEIVPEDDDPNKLNQDNPKVKLVEKFFKKPTGRRSSYREFIDAVLEDYLVIGSVALERVRTRGGQFMGELRLVDASTIRVFIDEYGRVPEAPEVAYAQVIHGSVQSKLTQDELIFENRANRTNSVYGLSPIESVIIQAESAIQGSLYSLRFFSDGNMPEGFLEMPEKWTVDQIKQFETYFNNLVAGNAKNQRKIKPVPSGANFTPVKKPNDVSYERFELWLLQQTCAVFGVPPQDIGFTHEVNKSSSDTQQEMGQERVLKPVSQFLEDVFTSVIQDDFGFTDLKFKFTDLDPVDKKEEAEVDAIEIKSGVTSVDEVRLRKGKDALGLGNYIENAKSLVLVEDLIDQELRSAKREMTLNPPKTELPEEKGEDDSKNEEEDVDKAMKQDLVTWRRKAARELKRGRSFSVFKSASLEPWMIEEISHQLSLVSKKEQIELVFKPYLDNSMQAVRELRKINDGLNRITKEAS